MKPAKKKRRWDIFKASPVFAFEDTDGKPLDYEQVELPELPFMERAEAWGISVKAVPGNYRYRGYYSPHRKEIAMASPEEKVFFHELAHAAHEKVKGSLTGGQDPLQEIVAELSAQALCRLVGTHSYAQQELMDLLEKKYRTPQGSGFHLAYLDAMEDLDPVLSCISGIIIVQLRERHVQWIYRKWIAGLDWNKKCVLINTLLDRMPSLPTNLQRCHPSQLADHVFELISTMVSANTTVRNTLTGDAALFGE